MEPTVKGREIKVGDGKAGEGVENLKLELVLKEEWGTRVLRLETTGQRWVHIVRRDILVNQFLIFWKASECDFSMKSPGFPRIHSELYNLELISHFNSHTPQKPLSHQMITPRFQEHKKHGDRGWEWGWGTFTSHFTHWDSLQLPRAQILQILDRRDCGTHVHSATNFLNMSQFFNTSELSFSICSKVLCHTETPRHSDSWMVTQYPSFKKCTVRCGGTCLQSWHAGSTSRWASVSWRPA